MLASLERPPAYRPGWRDIWSDFGPAYAANAFMAFIFTVTGPLALILTVGTRGGLSPAELASWVFGVTFINGAITVLYSWRFHRPLGMAWTIPGVVLVGPALTHLTFPEVIGAFYVTAALITVLALSGWVKRVMDAIPLPIVMGMVGGVFLRFGLDVVRALHGDFWIAGPMVIAFFVLMAMPSMARRMPPIIGSMLVGIVAIVALGRVRPDALGALTLAQPVIQAPVFSLAAILELVVPLAITVLVVQNGQGVAVLRQVGHEAPINTTALVCGVGSFLNAMVGSVSTCLTGPSNALLCSTGARHGHYTAALCYGVMVMAFGLLAPTFTNLMLATPKEFIMVLGGVAMLRVLQGAFVASFNGSFTMGALVALLVTVADLPLLNIGAAFWGLVAGFTVSWLVERKDFVALANHTSRPAAPAPLPVALPPRTDAPANGDKR